MDSLKLAFENATNDSTRCHILAIMVETEADDKIWPKYNEQLLSMVEEKLFRSSLSNSLKRYYLGYQASAFNNKGFVFDDEGDISNALEYYHKSLKIREDLKDDAGIAQSLNNIGVVYDDLGDKNSALIYYDRSLKIKERLKDKHGISYTLNNIGACYNNLKDGSKALQYYQKSLKLLEELNDKLGIAYALNNIGTIYKGQRNISSSLDYYQRSYKIYEDVNDKAGVTTALNNIATVMLLDGKLSLAKEFALKSLQKSRDLGFPYNILRAAETLKAVYQKQQNYKGALEMYELQIQMSDSINSQENKKAGIKNNFNTNTKSRLLQIA